MSTAKEPDLIQYRSAGQKVGWYTRDDDAMERGAMLRRALDDYALGNTYDLMAGRFHFKQEPLNLNRINLRGRGPDSCELRGTVFSDQLKAGAFSIGHTYLEGIRFVSVPEPDFEDDRCLSVDAPVPGIVTTIKDCEIAAGAWAIYGWPIGESTWSLALYDSKVFSGCQCLTGQGSGNPNAQSFDVRRTLLDVDPARSKCGTNQAVRNPNYGGALAAVLRGGKHSFTDVTIRVRGGLNIANCSGITDQYESGALESLRIAITNLDCQVIPDGTAPQFCHDVRLVNEQVRKSLVVSGTNVGSGEFRSLRMFSPIPVAKVA